MFNFLIAFVTMISISAFANQTKVADCKPITPALVAIPGEGQGEAYKASVLRVEVVELSQGIDRDELKLTAVFKGTNVSNKPIERTLVASLSSSIGGTYYSFNFYPENQNGQNLRYVKLELEFLDLDENTGSVSKALLSVLAMENAKNPTTGQAFLRPYTTRYFCDVVKPSQR